MAMRVARAGAVTRTLVILHKREPRVRGMSTAVHVREWADWGRRFDDDRIYSVSVSAYAYTATDAAHYDRRIDVVRDGVWEGVGLGLAHTARV